MIEPSKSSGHKVSTQLNTEIIGQNKGDPLIVEKSQSILSEHPSSKPQIKRKIHNEFSIISSIGEEFFQRIAITIGDKFRQLTGRRIHDSNKILSSQKTLERTQEAWLLNLALLRDAAESTTLTSEQRQQIQFLAANYLHKTAPIHISTMRCFFQKLGSMFQTSGLSTENDYYHRFSLARQINLGAEINKHFAMGNKSPLISTDTIEFQHLLPLKFKVIESSKPTSEDLSGVLLRHFSCDNPKKALNDNLSVPFLFDLTRYLKDDIQTNNNKIKEETFKSKYNLFKKILNKLLMMLLKI